MYLINSSTISGNSNVVISKTRLSTLQQKDIISLSGYKNITVAVIDWFNFNKYDKVKIEKTFYDYNYPCNSDVEEEEILDLIDECCSTRCCLIINNSNNSVYMYESLLLPFNTIERYERIIKLFSNTHNNYNLLEFGLIRVELSKEEEKILKI